MDWAKEAEQMKEISMDFFRDEVRNGFFIPTAVKQAWAAQLQVLDVIETICRKHDITYFADWGTMLGTVRHGGYVPWDDDMDICMKRADYTRFKEAAKTELPKDFRIHDYEHQEVHWLFLSRVANSVHINFEPEHMKQFHNFPYIAGIDIDIYDISKNSARAKVITEDEAGVKELMQYDNCVFLFMSSKDIYKFEEMLIEAKKSI